MPALHDVRVVDASPPTYLPHILLVKRLAKTCHISWRIPTGQGRWAANLAAANQANVVRGNTSIMGHAYVTTCRWWIVVAHPSSSLALSTSRRACSAVPLQTLSCCDGAVEFERREHRAINDASWTRRANTPAYGLYDIGEQNKDLCALATATRRSGDGASIFACHRVWRLSVTGQVAYHLFRPSRGYLRSSTSRVAGHLARDVSLRWTRRSRRTRRLTLKRRNSYQLILTLLNRVRTIRLRPAGTYAIRLSPASRQHIGET